MIIAITNRLSEYLIPFDLVLLVPAVSMLAMLFFYYRAERRFDWRKAIVFGVPFPLAAVYPALFLWFVVSTRPAMPGASIICNVLSLSFLGLVGMLQVPALIMFGVHSIRLYRSTGQVEDWVSVLGLAAVGHAWSRMWVFAFDGGN